MLGASLSIALPRTLSKGDEIRVELEWLTSPESTALQWLEPSQTAGGKLPYLFSQCQAIHARSFVPCQVRRTSLRAPLLASFDFKSSSLQSLQPHSAARLAVNTIKLHLPLYSLGCTLFLPLHEGRRDQLGTLFGMLCLMD